MIEPSAEEIDLATRLYDAVMYEEHFNRISLAESLAEYRAQVEAPLLARIAELNKSAPFIRRAAEIAIAMVDAFESGYSQGHNDTVEGCVRDVGEAFYDYLTYLAKKPLDTPQGN